ncbi:MAG: hypothetical protein C4K49_01430 [Candidatus Thorarchaeota archaeon]|nr:MAG: hypothetical protein C4K49_01430 [Candidatus Thorarchaeota archaeon]
MVIFGSSAGIIFDVNLIIQTVLAILLVAGVVLKRPLKRHGNIMAIATLANVATILLIMLPSLVRNFGAIIAGPVTTGILVTVAHVILGSATILLALLFGFRFFSATRNSKPLKCGTKRMMILSIVLWFVTLSAGLAFYYYYYLL